MRDEVFKMAEIFKAMGDPTRLRILKILASGIARDVKVSDIAEMLGVSQPAVSQHLKILKGIGVLTAEREGYRIYYNIDTDVFKQYKQLVDKMFQLALTNCGQACMSNGGKCPETGGPADKECAKKRLE